jgi:methylenetetrahydrofolate reductase (NADPH)
VLFAALLQKAPLATHITTQIVFDPKIIVRWARELTRRGITLPVYVGVPGGYSPDKIIRGLAPHLGEPDNHLAGFHVFTFNDLEPTEQWRQQALPPFPPQVSSSGPVRPGPVRPGAGRAEPARP